MAHTSVTLNNGHLARIVSEINNEQFIMEDNSLEDVATESEAGVGIRDVIRESFLDKDFENKYVPVGFQLIHNVSLQAQYEEKKQELLIRGRTTNELEEKFGFLVENSQSALESVCSVGLCTHDSEYNTLGYNCMGVYLCRHADVCLRHALVKYSGLPSIRVIICKFVMGRHTTAIPRVASSADFIEPTQGFDCHVSVIPPSLTDSLQNQFDRSQIYIYDINTLLQPAVRPRQVLPYAIVTYSVNGLHQASADADSLAASISDAVPSQLKQIIQQINAKVSNPAGVSSSFQRPASVSSSDGFHSKPENRAASTAKDASASSAASSKPLTGGRMNEQTDNTDSHLQRVISQINARLESQERSNRQTWSELAVQRATASAGASMTPLPGNVPIANDPVSSYAGPAKVLCPPGIGSAVNMLPSGDPGHQLTATVGAVGNSRTGAVPGPAYTLQEVGTVPRGYLAGMGAVAHPQVSIAAATGSSLAGGTYLGVNPATISVSRHVSVAMTPDLVGASSLAGVFASASGPQHLTSSQSFMPASAYYRTVPGLVDATGMAGLDPNAAALLSRVKYFPYAAASAASPDVGALASGFYPVPAVAPTDAAASGTSYALVNPAAAGAAVKRPLNDVMLYMVDKKPRFY